MKGYFEVLLQKICSRIHRNDIKFCEAIPLSVRLAVALRYLASGEVSLTSLCVNTIRNNKKKKTIRLYTTLIYRNLKGYIFQLHETTIISLQV